MQPVDVFIIYIKTYLVLVVFAFFRRLSCRCHNSRYFLQENYIIVSKDIYAKDRIKLKNKGDDDR
jgi:hypothetical protein